MRTPRLFLGVIALALILPLLLLACGGSEEPTDESSSERATAEPDNGRRRTVAHAQAHRRTHACGHRRADEAKGVSHEHPAAHH